jgi:hypothetical protein
MRSTIRLAVASALFATSVAAQASVYITEWMYNGDEFIEFTNRGPAPVDFTGWSYDDDSRTPGAVSLSAFGTVAAGESVILAESSAAAFRATWGLADTVKVIGGNGVNLGRNDEINLYDATSALVDRLTYGDQSFPGTIRTLNISGNPGTPSALGTNDVADWVLSFAGDGFGSYAAGDFVANPGTYDVAAVPEPSTYALLLAGLAAIFGVARRRAV